MVQFLFVIITWSKLNKPQHASDIVAVLNGRQNTAYGFKWELA